MQKRSTTAIKIIQAILTATICYLVSSSTALAAAQVTLTVKNPDPYTGNQSWFVYTKNPGETIEDIASIKNFGDESANVLIYPVDATTSDAGSFILKFEHENQNGIGEWTTVSKSPIAIKPNERIDIPFSIHIPKDISPGQYIGGIVLEYGPSAKSPQQSDVCVASGNCGQGLVSVKTRIGSRIYLTIPGKAYETFDLTDFHYYTSLSGQPRFKFTIVNNGNVTYQPQAEITIRDSAGRIYDSFTKPLGNSMPGTTIEPVISWDTNKPLFGAFTATAKVNFAKRFALAGEPLHGAAITKTVNFWIIPWDYILYASVFIIIAAMIYYLRKISAIKAINNSESYVVQSEDDLMNLAERLGVSWRSIARLNKLKAPYILRTGTTIRIPKRKQ
jgi:hypothetical protein